MAARGLTAVLALSLLAAISKPPAAAATSVLRFSVTPPGPPAGSYRTDRRLTPGQRRIQQALERAGLPLRVDAGLCRAAHAYAMALGPDASGQPPMDAVEFLLHRAGCPDATASATVVYTTEDGVDEAIRQIRSLLTEPETRESTHVGLARTRASTPPYRWRWGIYLVTRRFTMHPFPLTAPPGARLPLQLTLDPTLAEPRVLVTRPGQDVAELPAATSKNTLITTVTTGGRKGVLWVEVVADGHHGPEVVALFPVWVGLPVPARWEGPAAPEETSVRTLEDAERLLGGLVNRDREEHGLPPLEWDPALAAIARAHSRDMAERGYFGHRSPIYGELPQRLAAAGYRALWAGENVARAGSIEEAEEALMRSPGHRANILATQPTRLGVGVASGPGENRWLITQIFARPAPELDAAGWRRAVRRRLNAARRRRRAPPFPSSPELDAVATRLAVALAAGQTDTRVLLHQAKATLDQLGRRPTRLLVRTASVWTPEQVPELEPALDWAGDAGVGVAIPVRSDRPVAVVILLAAE